MFLTIISSIYAFLLLIKLSTYLFTQIQLYWALQNCIANTARHDCTFIIKPGKFVSGTETDQIQKQIQPY
jgi:hypothetical protein